MINIARWLCKNTNRKSRGQIWDYTVWK